MAPVPSPRLIVLLPVSRVLLQRGQKRRRILSLWLVLLRVLRGGVSAPTLSRLHGESVRVSAAAAALIYVMS